MDKMNTCTRCGGKFPTRTSGMNEPGPYCLNHLMCDDNLNASAAGVAAAMAKAMINAMDAAWLTEENLSACYARVIANRGDRPQTANEAIDAMAHQFSPRMRATLKRYARGETIDVIRARHASELHFMADCTVDGGNAMERLQAALKGGAR